MMTAFLWLTYAAGILCFYSVSGKQIAYLPLNSAKKDLLVVLVCFGWPLVFISYAFAILLGKTGE